MIEGLLHPSDSGVIDGVWPGVRQVVKVVGQGGGGGRPRRGW